MFAVVCLSVLACVSAAPQYYRPPPPFQNHNHHGNSEMQPFFGDSVFDTAKFWSELSSEMLRIDEVMTRFMANFPTSTSTAGFEGNHYKINIVLTGYEEKDIVVKAREGLVMVQAAQKTQDGNGRSYMDLRTLPATVDAAGTWTYDQNVLKIVFPLKGVNEEPTGDVSTEVVTEGPKEREDMESQEHEKTNQDADVGAEADDSEILSNEIERQDPANTVEATTYAIDVKGEVEFVPVRY